MIPAEFAQVFYEVCDRLEDRVEMEATYDRRDDPEAREIIHLARTILSLHQRPMLKVDRLRPRENDL